MNAARSRALFSLPMTRETTAWPAPPNLGESWYLRLAEGEKGRHLHFPALALTNLLVMKRQDPFAAAARE